MIDLPTESEPVRVVQGDCLDVLRSLPDGCVDAVVTDPPYPCIRRSYGYWTEAEWFALMNPLVEQCRRVLKPTGSAVFVLQPNSERVGRMRTWLWEFMAKWGREWGMVQDAYWWNTKAMPEAHAIQGRLMRPSIKACVWLGPHDCYRDQDGVLWSESDSTRAYMAAVRARASDSRGRHNSPSGHGRSVQTVGDSAQQRGGVCPFNVIPADHGRSQVSAGSTGHGAGTPLNLARWWVRYICPPGGVILEPFGGSGTVALAAIAEGRRCLLIEKEAAYCDIARKRVAEAMGGGLLAVAN